MEATAMAASPPPRRGTILSILPPELLVDVLSLVSPQDVASFAQTCHDADSLVYGTGSATDNLWRRLFLDRCDKPSRVPPPVDDTTTSSSASASVPSYMRSSLKALTRARSDLRHGARRQPVLASSHGRTLRTLVNAMESRALRHAASSVPNHNDDVPPSRTAATLASMFPANYVGDQRWAAFVYPREKVKSLSRWQEEAKLGRQRKLKMEEEKAKKTEAAMAKKRAKTRASASKDIAAGRDETMTAAAAASSSSTASAPAPATAASSSSPSQTASSKKRRRASSHAGQEGTDGEPRRSARIQRRVAAAARDVYVPSELIDFLEKAQDRRKVQPTSSKKAQAGPSTAVEPADDDDVVSRLEALAASLDEEAAAQLHVLHGIRLMRMPTEDEKQRLVAKARRKKRKEIEEMAKERKKAKAAAAANGSKGKGKEAAMESDADDTDVQASSQGNENVKGKGASKSKKPSSSKATAARRRRVRKAMNESDEDEPLLHRGYQSQDGHDYAQYPSVMSAQNAPALPLPAVTIPAYGQLPRLYSSTGKGIYHEPRLFDGPSDDEREKAIKNATENDVDDDDDTNSLNSDARMDEFFEFRMMVDEAYHDGYFDSREHRDAVIQGRASPPPHIDDEMQRIHDRLKRGKSLDDPPSDDDANGQDYDSDASYVSPPPPSMTPSDFSDDWTPGLDFDTEHSVHQVNSFLGASKGPGGDAMLRREAKELVYDAGRYAFENAWGPFKPFRSGGRGGRRAIGPWEMMQLGLLDDEEEDEEEDNEQIEEVVDMETLDAQAAAQGITWEPGQDESDDSGTPAPTSSAASQAIADYPATTTAATTAAAPAPASDLAPTTTDDEDFESDDGLSSGPSMSGSSDDSDDDAMHFGGVGPTDFARMVQRVGSYAGVKVRNRFEDEEKERKSKAVDGQATASLPRRVKVDWLLAEAIMIVVHANLHHAIHRRGWGSGFILPRGARGDDERTLKDAGWWRGGPGPLDDCSHKRNRRLLYPHAGWAMSRGEERPRELTVQRDDDDNDADDDKAEASAAAKDTAAPAVKDWANVEAATWMGTYFFLDYPHFLRYNSRLATEGSDGQRPTKSATPGTTSETGAASELLNRSEATGDCLALRLTLRPPNRQAAEYEEGEEEAATYGPEDPEFPTLRFSGRTYTFMSLDDAARLREQQQMAAGSDDSENDDDMMNEDLSEDEHGGPILPPPTARGHAHGFVRPVYSEDPTQQRARYHAASGKWLPLIVAIQWRVTHAYEEADRWSLSGVQAGPPGTRAPIYGTWSDVERDDGSPLGPFAYFNVDSRPWAEVERLRQEEVERKERAIQARRQKARELRLQRQQEEVQQQGQQAGGATTAAATVAA